jgi:class 3 adenylate cyclase
MNDKDKKKQDYENEREEIRQRINEFEGPEGGLFWTENRIKYHASFLNLIIESLPNPFYVIDTSDYTIKIANSASKFDQFLKSSTCYALIHKKDQPCNSAEHPCPIETIRKTKKPMTVEHIHFDKDGNRRNVEIHAFPIFDSDANVTQIAEYVTDITDRKKAEDKLKWELAVNSALSECFKPLVSPLSSIEHMANTILKMAKSLTGSEHGFVSSIDPSTGNNVIQTITEMHKGQCKIPEKNKINIFLRGKDGLYPGLWGHCLNTLKGFFTNSPKTHEAKKGMPEGHLNITRFLSVPVLFGSELVGQISLANKDIDYTNRELEAIHRLAQFYALAIQRKRTEDALQESNDDLERRVEERTAELLKSTDDRAFIRETFGAYLSDEVVAEILTSHKGVKLGGEMRDMTVLVSDLVGFTTITESMEPPQIVKIINRYLEKMIDIIVRYEGTIDEFTGDGILVFFGAPRLLPNHTERAVVCAIKMQESMKELNEENRKLGLPHLEMGIGINCGKLVVGNIGSEKRKKYGAVGSPINMAFRIQEKTRPGEILVTQPVKDNIGAKLHISSHWIDSLKGTGNTVIYRVIGIKEL